MDAEVAEKVEIGRFVWILVDAKKRRLPNKQLSLLPIELDWSPH